MSDLCSQNLEARLVQSLLAGGPRSRTSGKVDRGANNSSKEIRQSVTQLSK